MKTFTTVTMTVWRRRQASFSALAAALFAIPIFVAVPAQAQEQNRNDRVFTCQSTDGERVVCAVDTSRGQAQLTRQLGEIACREGRTWGRQDGAVWVDRGCRAEFLLPPPPRIARIEPGTEIAVRTNETISARRVDGRVFTGVVAQDVPGENGRVAIPRGSNVELIVRVARDQDLVLDLESVAVDGQRYAVDANADRVQANSGVGDNKRTGEFVGGGAILGAILGASVGGGKGAAIGAGVGAGAGAGAEIATSGREVRIPAESIIRFRIDRPLIVGHADEGFDQNGNHFHR